MKAVLVGSLLSLALAACGKVEEPTVGGAKLGEADGTIEAPAGVDVPVLPGKPAVLPASGTVRLAIDRNVPFQQVQPLLEQLWARDGKAIALVTNTGLKRKVLAMELFPAGEKRAQATQVAAYANGKMCVNLPGVDESKCSQGRTGHIDRASTRSIVREAYQAEAITYAVVSVEPALEWGDVVRAVDGARTCCGEGVPMQVELRERQPDEFHVPLE